MNYAIDKSMTVILNGDAQNIRIRAAKEGLRPILFLHGGPGVCDRHWVLKYQSAFAEEYTMVCWDQRGSGKSYRKSIKDEKLSVDVYVEDARALVEFLVKKFGYDKIIVAGHSWGTIIGTALVSRYPEHIAAYIGQGQFVNGTENEWRSYRFCAEEAERRGDAAAVKALRDAEPKDGVYPSHKAMMLQRNYLSKYGGSEYREHKGMIRSLLIPLLRSDEYTLKEIADYARGAMYLTDVLWSEVVALEFDRSVRSLEVPLIITQGRHDYNTPSSIAREWFDALDAPFKKWIWLENSAHSPIKEEPEIWGKAVRAALREAIKTVES